MGTKKKRYPCIGNTKPKYTARLKKANQARKKKKEDNIQLNQVALAFENMNDEREKDVNLSNTSAVSKDLSQHLSQVEEAHSTSVPLRLHSANSVVESKGLKLSEIEKNDAGKSRLSPPEESIPRLRSRGNSKKSLDTRRCYSISSRTTAAASHNHETLTKKNYLNTQILEEETNEPHMSLRIEKDQDIMPEQSQGIPDDETNESDEETSDPDMTLTIEKEGDTMPTPDYVVEGRRVIDYEYFMKQLTTIESHGDKFGCRYKLIPDAAKKFTAPETFSVVGGKPLRKRSEKPPPESELKKQSKSKAKRGNHPESLAVLCQIVIREYNLLPQCEETEHPTSSKILIKKSAKKRGRPPKTEEEKKAKPKKTKVCHPTKTNKNKPRKEQTTSNEYGEPSSSYSFFLEQSRDIRAIKVEQDMLLDQSPENDPLQEEDDFTVVIKEEIDVEPEDTIVIKEEIDVEPEEMCTPRVTVDVPQATAQGIVINPMAQVEIPSFSSNIAPKTITVVMDEYQLFANSVAEQLRALPQNRALLLQFDIQSMIDNEKQLMGHES